MAWLINEWYTPYIYGYSIDIYKQEVYVGVNWDHKSVYLPFYWNDKKVVIITS